jgi:hypothetical protein
VLIELIITAFVAAYVAIVALGHVLLMAAIYECPREDGSGGRGRMTAVRPRIAAATPVNRTQGADAIIAGSVSDEDAKKQCPQGWKAAKPCIRVVPQPQPGR